MSVAMTWYGCKQPRAFYPTAFGCFGWGKDAQPWSAWRGY